jgi:transposase-like protein
MDAAQPRVRVVHRHCAPRSFPCPHCGKLGRRKDVHVREVRDIAYREILILRIEIGEYRARCHCCKTFRATVEGIEARAAYSNRVRDAVIDRLLDDRMSMEALRQALQRDFLLELSDGFLYDCLDWKVRQIDLPAYRQWTLQQFSGTLCVDEIHLGHRTLLLATDPIGDFPVAFALVSANDQDHMRRFLANLKRWGFEPKVVVTDGSNLYPAVLAEVWPKTRHQLCVFHVLKDINDCVLDAVRRLRRGLARRGRRKARRGRLNKRQRRARDRAGKTKKEQAHFIWKRRHLIVTRPEELDDADRRDLTQMLEWLPELLTVRLFVLRIYGLFDPTLTPHQARCHRAALVKVASFQADPDLARALAMLPLRKFNKMIAYLHSPAGQRVRTNNHVERTNRRLRYLEKVRYKWRRRRTIVRFVVLALDRWRQRQVQAQEVERQRQLRQKCTPRVHAPPVSQRSPKGTKLTS